jgi:ssDNA-binding Zn-finger/Zn-ribbon topoisomerase 1
MVRPSKKECKVCGFPGVLVIKGRRAQEICFNPDCKSKEIDKNLLKEKRKCPKCGEDLVVKKGPFGAFFACPGYPKCRHIEGIKNKK